MRTAMLKCLNSSIVILLLHFSFMSYSQDKNIYVLKFCSENQDTTLVCYFYNQFDSTTYYSEVSRLKDLQKNKSELMTTDQMVSWMSKNILFVGSYVGGWMVYPEKLKKNVLDLIEKQYLKKNFESEKRIFHSKEYRLISIDKYPNLYTLQDYQKAEKPSSEW